MQATFFKKNLIVKLLTIVFLLQLPLSAFADSSQRLIQMLDYIGVDYPHTIKDSRIVDPVEYTEMREFSTELVKLMNSMPENEEKHSLLSAVQVIENAIQQKQDGQVVASKTRKLKQKLIQSYAIVISPAHVPDIRQMASLYISQCASCHGTKGDGKGALASTLNPPPSNFHDMGRQYSRSVYDLYNTISLGVSGTAMKPFDKLTDKQRWGLAFYISQFSASEEQRKAGEAYWKQGDLKQRFTSLSSLTGSSYADAEQAAVAQQLDKSVGTSVLAYLRSQPAELDVSDHAAIDKSIAMLKQSSEKARAGDAKGAHAAALSAYLDGFELAEPSLVIADSALKKQIESEMIAFRELSKKSNNADELGKLENTQQRLVTLLEQAKNSLKTNKLTASSAFFGAFIILLREGVEAILVLAAMMAALIKTGRKEAIKFIHAGWISAVVLGILTWWVAENLIAVSGASREITEGIAALLAAAILIYVGYWLQNASHSQRWQKFIQHKVSNAMENRTLWILASVSFIAVYREMFETVLFYQAMWVQVDGSSKHSFLFGILAAIGLLVIIAFLIFRLGVRLPIKQFFQINAVLIFALAVIFTGQGIAALQEAGFIPASLLKLPTIEMLGIYPTLQGIGLQLTVLLLGIALLIYQKKKT